MTTITSSGTSAHPRHFFADLSVNVKILAAISLAVLVAIAVGVVGLLALSTSSGPRRPSIPAIPASRPSVTSKRR